MNTVGALRIAIAGLGFGRKVILPAARAATAVTPTALWHPDPHKVEAAARGEELKGFSDFPALLDDPQVDAVVMATPPAVRHPLACEALAAGKPVFLEKPIALNAEEGRQLHRQALQSHLVCGVDFEYRAVPLFQQVAHGLQQGQLGPLSLVKLDWLMSSRADAGRPWSWYAQRDLGGGVIGALGVHAFDCLAWLLGPIRTVHGSVQTVVRSRPDPQDGSPRACDSEEVALVNLTFASGLIGQASLSSVTRNGRGMWLELYGRDGQLVLGSSNQRDYVHGFQLQRAHQQGRLEPRHEDGRFRFERTWADGRIAPVARLLSWWAAAIRDNRPMIPGLAEGIASQAVADAVKRSAASGMTVNVGLF